MINLDNIKRLIIFDFFGVLGGELSPKFFAKHFNDEEAKRLKDNYFVPADNGDYTITETFKRISDDLNIDYDLIYNEFKENVSINYELFDYIKKLREKNTVALLSNAAKGIFELYYPSINLEECFDKVFISSNYHMQKPQFRFYNLCKDSFNIKFDEVYMIDDNIKNIKDLNQIDITGIQYINNEELFKKLDQFI